jgi:hypothetical protein
MPDSLAKPDDAQSLVLLWKCLGPYEREIVMDSMRRLLEGQNTYGKFQDLDNRDFNREAYAEVIDLAHYAARMLQRMRYLG